MFTEACKNLTDTIDYEAHTKSAMRGVVRDVLRSTQENGMPIGEHHFYITFLTGAKGVKIAQHLKERFPQDMTIVVQRQYWDLEIYETYFEIVLKFSGVPQHLQIPFTAITRFFDPSVNFGLTFEASATDQDDENIISAPDLSGNTSATDPQELPKVTGTDTVISLDSFRRK